MVDLSKQFIEFHNAIKLEYDDNKELRDKRDELLSTLKENMSEDAGSYDKFHQGSYAMNTGIKSLDGGDYDIDVGIIFHVNKDDYPNPVKVKRWVYDALKEKYENVEMKKPCVTVKFDSESESERNYHVDFAIYIDGEDGNETVHHAKGKLHSTEAERCWDEADPKELVSKIKNHSANEKDREQFRRVIRYLKRWKDVKFKGQVNRPSGIGLTVAGLSYFQAIYEQDLFNGAKQYNDLEALDKFIQNMLNGFVFVTNSETFLLEERLQVKLPTPTYNDIYEKMSASQMKNFKDKLQTLLDKIREAQDETDPVKAAKLMREQFGDSFPVPEKSTTAEQRGPSFLSDTSSA